MVDGADAIDNVSQSISSLSDTLSENEKKFRLSSSALVQWAGDTGKASKRWTTFSRITAGTGIWKFQNYLRGALEIIGAFGERTEEAIQHQTKQEKALAKTIKGVKKINEEYSDLAKALDINVRAHDKTIISQLQQADALSKLTDYQKDALQNTSAYNRAIIQGKSENEAYALSFLEVRKSVKLNDKQFKDFQKRQQQVAKQQENMKTKQGRRRIQFGIDYGTKRKLRGQASILDLPSKIKGSAIGKGLTDPKAFKAQKKAMSIAKKQLKADKKAAKKLERIEKFEILKIKYQLKTLAFVQFMKPIMNMFFKFLIFGILGMIAVLAIAKVAYDIMGVLADFGVFDDMKEIFLGVVNILGAVFGILGSFLSGDFTSMFDYLGTIMSSLMTIGWNLVQIFAKGIFGIVVGLFYSIIDGIYWFFDGGWKVAIPAFLKLGITLLGIYFAKYLLTQALLLIGIYAMPLMVFVLIAALITAVVMRFEPVRKALTFISDLFKTVWGWITGIWDAIKSSINTVLDWFGADPLAKGGITHGNVNLVGENGPERVRLPAGSRVFSNSQSRSMANASTVINNHITINAKDTSDAELRRIAQRIGTLVNNKINRSTSSRTLG